MVKKIFFINQGDTLIIDSIEYEILLKLFNERGISFDSTKFKQNFVEIPKQYVGIIELQNRTIIIKPKLFGLDLSHILRMYYFIYLNNTVDLDASIFGIDKINNQSIVDLFIKELLKVVKIGLPMQYKDIHISSKFANGTINLLETYIRLNEKKPNPFRVNTSNLSHDIDINQILYLAYRKVYDIVDNNVKGLLDSTFQGIARINRIHKAPKITRNLKYCEKVLTLAYIIINDMSVTGFGDSGFGENILINFDKLFECFIQKVLIVYSDDMLFTTWNEPHYFGEYVNSIKETVTKTYQPDLLYNYRKTLTGEVSTCILDMKNKTSNPFNNADVYQMCFYSSMLNTTKVILCYPSATDQETIALNLLNDGIKLEKIHAVYINLSGNSADEFKKNIYIFIERIFEIIE